MTVINIRQDEEKKYVDILSEIIEATIKKKSECSFAAVIYEDGGFCFDWFGKDPVKIIGLLETVKNHIINNYVLYDN